MEITCYNFLFHPFQEDHSKKTTTISVITNIALTALTSGLYVIAFLSVHLLEGVGGEKSSLSSRKSSFQRRDCFVGVEALKQKQYGHLLKLQKLANEGKWQHLQTHTFHPDSGFDWWMFPIDRSSRGQGNLYKLSLRDIENLKKDAEFMANYREGVCLVAKSWGWDLINGIDVTNESQKWTRYGVRLHKMITSLQLFKQTDLLETLQMFMLSKGIQI